MPINPAELLPENRLVKSIDEISKAQREQKTAQLIGGDNPVVQSHTVSSFSTGSIAAGSRYYYSGYIQPAIQVPSVWDLAPRIRVDTDDANHEFPHGSSLNSSQLDLYIVLFWNDGSVSDDSTGKRGYTLVIHNDSALPHTYFVRPKVYGFTGEATLT